MTSTNEELLPRVAEVQTDNNFQLLLKFTNGEIRQFNAKPLLKYPVYKSLITNFPLASVQFGTVVWPGDIDISPDKLYLRSTPV